MKPSGRAMSLRPFNFGGQVLCSDCILLFRYDGWAKSVPSYHSLIYAYALDITRMLDRIDCHVSSKKQDLQYPGSKG